MKRREFLRHLEQHGCELLREGAKHTVYVNRQARKSSTIPRHRRLLRTTFTAARRLSSVVGWIGTFG